MEREGRDTVRDGSSGERSTLTVTTTKSMAAAGMAAGPVHSQTWPEAIGYQLLHKATDTDCISSHQELIELTLIHNQSRYNSKISCEALFLPHMDIIHLTVTGTAVL